MDNNKIEIFTDGACRGNPGPGGWGALLRFGSKEKEIDDHVLRQTLFLFNLELWYQIFIERDNMKNPNLSLDSFL